ncbi:DUF222 domain-containing protein [Rhodococcus spelaei]|uniref:DUF222 domain-containing protein n=1 Tax=Rhodococcus spelaei TaxID=2546320 RepID=A0A541B1V5_9NOCA|nr:HNH endonuclease signature motif containing protein [Rhodococcus spelaei]TQF66310.1 DUF222 domain-containing protein [Rhodococcus spelaei]
MFESRGRGATTARAGQGSSWRVFTDVTIDPDPLRTTVHSDHAIAEMDSRIEGAVAEILSDTTTLTAISEYARDENRAAARKIIWAARLWENWIERDVRLGSGDIVDCGNGAIAEISVRLGCSRTMAQTYAEIGMDLRLRLPETRHRFEAGDLDLARVRVICRETTSLTPGTLAELEPEVVAAARHLTPGPLAADITRLITLRAPDEAAAARDEDLRQARKVVKRSRGTWSSIEVGLSPDEAEQIMQVLTEIAATLCPHDHRGRQTALVDTVLALVHGERHLTCGCGRDDCTATGPDGIPGRRTPLTQITITVETLLGLLSEPAYLHGHGPITPDLAHRLAADGTWQMLLTETLELAEHLGLINNSDASAGGNAGDTEPTVAVDPNDRHDNHDNHDNDSTRVDTPALAAAATSSRPQFSVRAFLTRGSRRRAGYLPPIVAPPAAVTSAVPASVGTIADAILAAVDADPGLVTGIREGHGGLLTPPPGALTYRPDAATAALVRARDGHCRFPGCQRPATGCQLDHIVEFRQWDPIRGGWTVVTNLQCLCAFHHQLKTLGFWTATALGNPATTGHALLWTSTTTGTRAVTLPATAHGHPDPASPAPTLTSHRRPPRAAPNTDAGTPVDADDPPPF